MEQVSTFMKFFNEYFNDIRTKERDSRRVYTKLLIINNIELKDLVKMIK